MTKGKRRALIWTGSVFGIVAVALAIFISTLDQNKAKKYISAGVTKATGRQLSIKGDINLDLGWTSRLSASEIQFANADWSQHPQMAEVGLFDVEIDLWQLLTKFRLVLPTVTISRPRMVLEKNAEGTANWEFRAAAAAAQPVPEKRSEFPVIQNLVIKDGALLFDDQVSKTQADLKLIQAEAAGFLDAPVKLKAEGTYQKLPLTISLDGGSYENLRNSKDPYPLQINLVMGKLIAKIDGNLTEPLEMKGEDVTLDIQGDDMANLFPLIRLVFPKTPPYRLKGHLKHEGSVWSFSNFSGRVGDSDLHGNIRVDTAPKRPMLQADLVSNLLDFDDLAGFIGGTPGTGTGETASEEQKKQAAVDNQESDRIFPDQRYDLERLGAMDADVRLRAKRILAPNLPIDDLNATLNLNDGVLSFAPAAFGVANGSMEIYSRFDGSKRPSKVKIDARLRQMDLKRFLGQSSFAQKSLAPISGRIVLSGTGESFRELMATASGNSFLAMSGGQISAMLVELAGLDVAESLGYLVRGDQSIAVRCGLLDLQGQNGQMAVQTLVFDSADTVIHGEGKIDLRDERVDIVVLPVPKDFSPLSLRSYIRAHGPFNNLSVFPDPIKTGTDSWIKKIFNVLTMLVLSPFQPRDIGQGTDVDCDALMDKAQRHDPQGIVVKDIYKSSGPKAREPAQRHASRSR